MDVEERLLGLQGVKTWGGEIAIPLGWKVVSSTRFTAPVEGRKRNVPVMNSGGVSLRLLKYP